MAIEVAQEDAGHAPAAGTDVAVSPAADPVTTALAEVTKTNTTITQHLETARGIAMQFAGVVADVRTTKGYEEIAKIRTRLREEGRYPIQGLKKEGSKLLGTMQRQFNQRCDDIIEEVLDLERPFQEQLDAEDQRKENERKEREEAEARRKQAHMDAIAAITSMVTDAMGMGSVELKAQIEAAEGIIVDDGYQEFQGQAQQARDEAVRQLRGMLVSALADEAERAEIEETRRRQAEFAEQQRVQREAAEAAAAEARAKQEAAERESAALREKVAAMEREAEARREEQERAARERAEAIQRRIDAIKWVGEPLPGRSSEELRSIRAALERLDLTADLLGDRLHEAQNEVYERIGLVDEAIAAAVAREAEEERQRLEREEQERQQAQAARREELLANIVGAGDNALLAVQDGSADVAELQRNLNTLEELAIDAALVGDRIEEFIAARDVAIGKAMLAIEQTQERDRLRAEEQERQRQEQEKQAAARAKYERTLRRLPELYLLAQMLAGVEASGDTVQLVERAQALVKEIEGDDNHA
jgi:hypothetical protein